ncbi:MAG: GDSL-type esterase/lipase family protein [Sandaracinaceae bacterium]
MVDEPHLPPPRRDESLGAENANTLLVRPPSRPALGRAAATRDGLAHLATVVAIVAGLMTLSYLVPPLARLRPWVEGEGIPVVRMFRTEEPLAGGMALATGGAVRGRSASPTALGGTLGDEIAANLEDDVPAAAPAAPRRPARPAEPAAEPSEPAPIVIAPEELRGLMRRVEDPTGEALTPFYRALERTARGEEGAITRVAHYGDSSIAGDGITMTLRRRFQQRFGDGGHGFHLIARGTMPYRHRDVAHRERGSWELRQLVRAGLGSHRYGYGGVQARGIAGAWASFGTSEDGPVGGAASRFELFFLKHPRGGRVEMVVDDGPGQMVDTRAPELVDGRVALTAPPGPHELTVRVLGGGEARLYGVVLETDGPGVVYDSLGMVGARARRMLGFDLHHLRQQHRFRRTHLVVLAFGGNEADDLRHTMLSFEQDYRRVIALVREAWPSAGCLLMGPLDQGERDERGAIRTMPQIPVIVQAQRRAARAEGCAYFDTFGAMGGPGSMRRWFRATPRLAFGDFRHATPAGYRVVGNMLYKALLRGFADHLAAKADGDEGLDEPGDGSGREAGGEAEPPEAPRDQSSGT